MKKNDGFLRAVSRSYCILKILRIMKLTTFLFFFTVVQVLASGTYSQDTKLTLGLGETTVGHILSEIENQSEFYFLFNQKLIDVDRKVNVQVDNKDINESLAQVFSGTDVEYIITDRQIVLSRGDYLAEVKTKLQPLTITGTVTDENGEPLPGLTIVVKGTTKGAVTDLEGKYTIEVDDPSALLVFSYVGYLTQEISVGNQTTINVNMETDVFGLEEVVVIGYGTVKKSDLTGSVGVVMGEAVNSQVVQNPLMALTGVTAGIQVSQQSGEPGSSFYVRIRGANSIAGGNDPLYVLDGFPITGNLDNINPNDIESMNVLKDASATAIYGSRGANGVILVTTKQGVAGKTRVEYDGYYGVQNVTKKIDMLNAKEFATLANVRAANDGEAPFFSESEIASFGEGTFWQDEVFQTAPIQNHSLMVSGGNIRTRFNVSANYFDQQGIIRKSYYNRYQLKVDVDHKISANWKISVHNILSRTKKNGLTSDNVTRGAGVLSSALVSPPTKTVYDDLGNYSDVSSYPFSPDILDNCLLLLNAIKDQNTKHSNLSNLSVEGTFLKDLTFKTSLGIEYYINRHDYYSSTEYTTFYNGNATIDYRDFMNILSENTLTYLKEIGGNHILTVLGGITAQKTINQTVYAGSNDYITDAFENYNLEAGSSVKTPTSGYTDYSILSYLGRINYAYKDKYLLTASIRADGSSRFGKNNKWGYFPSAAIAWRVSKELFWPQSDVVNDFKIRASMGTTGNTAVSAYQSLSLLSYVPVVFDDNTYTSFAPGSVKPNPDLKWESTRQWDIGIDMGLLSNRLTFVFDYYHKVTSDLLASVPLPTSSGFSTTTSNIGSIENKGFEMSANYKLFKGSFSWDIGANISFNRNKVLTLSQGADVYGGVVTNSVTLRSLAREGYPMGVFYGYKEDGLTEEGDIKFVDTDNNGEINALDRVIIGDPNPDFIFGINSFLSYKNFGLTLLITGVQGNDIFNANLSNVADCFTFGLNQIRDVLGNYWTEENPDPHAKYPRVSQYTRYSNGSDRYISLYCHPTL